MATTFPISPSTGQKFTNGNKVWTWDGNSWKGGLTPGGDAGTLDSIDSASFLRSDTNDSFSGTLSGAGSVNITGTVTAASFTGSGSGLTNVNDSTKLPLAGGTMTGTFNLSDQKINFYSGNGGTTFSPSHYSMGKDVANGAWTPPHYSDLIIGYHTGIRIGANYSGTRFYANSPTTDANNDGHGDGGETLLMTVGGAGLSHLHVSVANNLTVGGDIAGVVSGTISTSGDGQNNLPFKLSADYSSYMVAAAGNTWGLFWAGNSGARYGTNGIGGPGNIWGNSTNPNEFVFVGSDSTKWTVNGNNGNTWQAGDLIAVGNVTAGGDVITNSDIRLKSDIRSIDDSLGLINRLNGKLYTKDGKKDQLGFIAQEVEQVLPQLVHTANDEMGTKSVNYQGIIALLVETVKELSNKIKELESKLNGV